MAEASFPTIQSHTLAYEGGYSNDPNDPGGVTLQGIIQREYDRWRKIWGKSKKALTRAMLGTAEWISERDVIYRKGYWEPLRCGDLLPGPDGAAYDYGVNSGVGRSAKVLQRLVGAAVDGKVGDKTVAAANARDPEVLAHRICEEREAFNRHLAARSAKLATFINGWLRRDASVDAYTGALAQNYKSQVVTAVPAPAAPPAAKAQFAEPRKTKAAIKGASPTAAAEEAARSGQSWGDWIYAHQLETALIAAAVVAAVVLVVWLINRWHRTRQEAPVPGFDYTPLPIAAKLGA